jgi:hypothetical protein
MGTAAIRAECATMMERMMSGLRRATTHRGSRALQRWEPHPLPGLRARSLNRAFAGGPRGPGFSDARKH